MTGEEATCRKYSLLWWGMAYLLRLKAGDVTSSFSLYTVSTFIYIF